MFKLIRKIKLKIRSFFHFTVININKNFESYSPASFGSYKDRAKLTINTINQVFPRLDSLNNYVNKNTLPIINLKDINADKKSVLKFKKIFDNYGSDKADALHEYHNLYVKILGQNPDKIKNIFEIGLGTNNKDVVSTMGRHGKPGASLRAFREYCQNANIYGADIDKRILFEEDRIKTFFVDQTNPDTFDEILKKIPNDFDLVIDDGLHSPDANISSLEFGLKIIKIGGWVVIEDISPKSIHVWQIVSSILPDNYMSQIFKSNDNIILFTVNRLK